MRIHILPLFAALGLFACSSAPSQQAKQTQQKDSLAPENPAVNVTINRWYISDMIWIDEDNLAIESLLQQRPRQQWQDKAEEVH